VVTLNASWDVWSHGHAPMELYGEGGSVFVPDPNFFGGEVRLTHGEETVTDLPGWDHPFHAANESRASGKRANYRTAGLADMALAILEGRPHRCSLEASLHAVEVMTGVLASAETGRSVSMRTSCERPTALGPEEARTLLATVG
jgi:predicted dehydrogenase